MGGSAHCIRRQRGGPLGYVVFLRWTPLESPPSCSTWAGVSLDPGPTHSFTEAGLQAPTGFLL